MISFRSYQNFNSESFKQDLSLALWHIGEVFEDVDDQLFFLEHMVIFFRSYKNFSGENFKQDLSSAPWRIGEVFKDLDDQLLF